MQYVTADRVCPAKAMLSQCTYPGLWDMDRLDKKTVRSKTVHTVLFLSCCLSFPWDLFPELGAHFMSWRSLFCWYLEHLVKTFLCYFDTPLYSSLSLIGLFASQGWFSLFSEHKTYDLSRVCALEGRKLFWRKDSTASYRMEQEKFVWVLYQTLSICWEESWLKEFQWGCSLKGDAGKWRCSCMMPLSLTDVNWFYDY